MLQGQLSLEHRSQPSLTVALARYRHEVREAQRLRYKVFAEEMGVRLPGEHGIDADRFDEFCEHLLVRDAATGEVVGTYRILLPDGAARAGGCYSEREFDLARLARIRSRMIEVGRSCIHPDYRSGAAITLLWAELARYMVENGYEFLGGCASIGMSDGGRNAVNVYRELAPQHLSPPEYRVFPHCPLLLDAFTDAGAAQIPPLVKGYLRLGAYIAGGPAWDPDFNTADLFVFLPRDRIDPRYARRFFGKATKHASAIRTTRLRLA